LEGTRASGGDRAAIVVAALGMLGVALTQAFTTLAFAAETWRVALYVVSLAGFVAAVSAVAVLVPRDVLPFSSPDQRAPRLVGIAAGLFLLGLVLNAVLLAAAAIEASIPGTPTWTTWADLRHELGGDRVAEEAAAVGEHEPVAAALRESEPLDARERGRLDRAADRGERQRPVEP
jgi:hypothetical protein